MLFNIHTGWLSVENGAIGPLHFTKELADAAGTTVNWGTQYGDDYVEVSPEDSPVVELMLIEHKMIYKVVGRDTDWQNVCSESVKNAFFLH